MSKDVLKICKCRLDLQHQKYFQKKKCNSPKKNEIFLFSDDGDMSLRWEKTSRDT